MQRNLVDGLHNITIIKFGIYNYLEEKDDIAYISMLALKTVTLFPFFTCKCKHYQDL